MEMWMINGQELFEFLSEQLVKETGVFSKGVNKGLNIARSAIRNVDAVKPINPEDLPIVQQLRKELARVTAELYEARESCEAAEKKYAACAQRLRQIQYCYDIAKNAEQQLRRQIDEITGKWAECAKKLKHTSEQLEQVTAERDAAVECIQYIEDDLDRGNDNDWAREHIADWERRGPQKEE